MSVIVQKIILRNQQHFGRRLPLHHLGLLLAELPGAIRAAVSMAFRHRSQVRGPRPAWLDRAADVRFVDHEGDGETVLVFEAPRLGDAAAEVYAQQSLFPDADDRPAQDDTAIDLLGDVLNDIAARDQDSVHYDPSLLVRIAHFHRVFRQKSPFDEVEFISRRFPSDAPARLNAALVKSAELLLGGTPAPQRIRLVGQLDALVASTQRFSVRLDTGETVMGVFAEDQADILRSLWRQRVLVLGTAVYRASGRLLRIDAEAVRDGRAEPAVFSRLPKPPGIKIDMAKLRQRQGPKTGLNAIIGKWPGDETEEEITKLLQELS